MSATRKPRAERGHDFYETPAWASRALLPHLPACSRVLDPCVGKGAILAAFGWPPRAWGIEIQPELAAVAAASCPVVTRDALAPDPWLLDPIEGHAQLVVMNPPYLLADAFVRRALAEVSKGGTVAALLRLGFLEGQARAALHREHPADVLVLPRRPSFDGKGTDASAYAWFVWGPGRGGRWQILNLENGDAR